MIELFSQSALCEYSILISPSDEVKQEVTAIKQEIFRSHGAFPGQNSTAHISLLSFFQSEDREDKLVYSLCETLKECREFDVFLNGFGFLPVDNSFYIDILDRQPILNLYHRIRVQLFKQLVSLSFMNRSIIPQVALGRLSSSMQYLNVLKEYEQKVYTNNFRVFHLTVLKRKAPFRTWEKLIDLPVGNPLYELW